MIGLIIRTQVECADKVKADISRYKSADEYIQQVILKNRNRNLKRDSLSSARDKAKRNLLSNQIAGSKGCRVAELVINQYRAETLAALKLESIKHDIPITEYLEKAVYYDLGLV